MKTNLILIIFTLFAAQCLAQKPTKREKKSERMEALKIAYFTKALDLNVEESKTFWPVYNAYDLKRKQIVEKRTMKRGGPDDLDESQAMKIIEEELRIESELLDLKTSFIGDLKNVISNVKIAKLLHAQKRFRKELLDNMKGRRKGKGKRKQRR